MRGTEASEHGSISGLTKQALEGSPPSNSLVPDSTLHSWQQKSDFSKWEPQCWPHARDLQSLHDGFPPPPSPPSWGPAEQERETKDSTSLSGRRQLTWSERHMTSSTKMGSRCLPKLDHSLRDILLFALLLIGFLYGITGLHLDVLHIWQFLMWLAPSHQFAFAQPSEKSGVLDMSEIKAEMVVMLTSLVCCCDSSCANWNSGIVKVKLFYTACSLAHDCGMQKAQ